MAFGNLLWPRFKETADIKQSCLRFNPDNVHSLLMGSGLKTTFSFCPRSWSPASVILVFCSFILMSFPASFPICIDVLKSVLFKQPTPSESHTSPSTALFYSYSKTSAEPSCSLFFLNSLFSSAYCNLTFWLLILLLLWNHCLKISSGFLIVNSSVHVYVCCYFISL